MANKLFNWFRKKETGPGLDIKYKIGESFPWKGIMFVVSKVTHDTITLSPVKMTGKFEQKLKQAR